MGRDRFALNRIVRGGRRFPNGKFTHFADALKAKANLIAYHRQERRSTACEILDLESSNPKPLPDDYIEDEAIDFDDTPLLPEEDPENRIKQLEDENAKLRKAIAASGGAIEVGTGEDEP